MSNFQFSEINALSDLLRPDDDDEPAPRPTLTPGSIGPVVPKAPSEKEKPKDPNVRVRACLRRCCGGCCCCDRAALAAARANDCVWGYRGGRAQAIWDEADVPDEDGLGVGDAPDPKDKRLRPTYDVLFVQDVGTEDVFLGTEKTPSSTDCSHITYKICFPGHKMADLELDVTKSSLRAGSKTHKLAIFLPMPVDSDQGKAKWDAKKDTLTVTLPIIRDEW